MEPNFIQVGKDYDSLTPAASGHKGQARLPVAVPWVP